MLIFTMIKCCVNRTKAAITVAFCVLCIFYVNPIDVGFDHRGCMSSRIRHLWLPRDRRFPNLANIGKNAKCRLRTPWCLLRNWPENTYQVGIAESSHCTRRVRKSLAYCTSFSQVPSVMTSTLTGVLRMFHFVKLARCDTEIF